MTELALPIWILAIASVLRLALATWESLRYQRDAASAEAKQREYDEDYEQRQEEQARKDAEHRRILLSLQNSSKQFYERITGRKIEEMTDAEIVQLVRTQPEPEDDDAND